MWVGKKDSNSYPFFESAKWLKLWIPQQIYPHSKAGPLLFRSQRKAPEVRRLVSGHLGLAWLLRL